MSFMSQIGLNLEQLAQNISRLQEEAATMPPSSEVRQVEGAQSEPAQEDFRAQLASIAGTLAAHTSRVRQYVERNASAFEQAAAAMQETDGADSLAARQANAFVQGIVADPATPAPGSAPAPAGGASRPAATGPTAW